MKVKSSPFDQLSFSKLFSDYISGNGSVHNFFETSIPNDEVLCDKAKRFQFKQDRELAVKLLKEYNNKFQPSKNTLEQIDLLSDPESLTVVTGQQVSLLGGPLFTVYKTVTAIIYARRLQSATGRPVVPVFWLADEDHDINEVSELNLITLNGTGKVVYEHDSFAGGQPAAATVKLGDKFERFQSSVFEKLDDTDFTNMIWTEIEKCYTKDRTFAEGFGMWLLKIFGDEGLILAGSNHIGIKEHSKSLFTQAVTEHKHIEKTLDDATYRLIEGGYHGQVQIHSSNLFYFNDQGERQKLQFDDNYWSIPDKKWTTDELVKEIESRPERVSPNVFLRPILQDHLLPVAAYVGGPGEIAYYAQMKEFYYIFEKEMPVIIPRFSITLIESAIDRIMGELPFDWTDYQQRIEDLETTYVKKTEEMDIEKMFSIWKAHIKELTRAKRNKISNIDPSLDASVGKATNTYFNELDKLKGKVYRSVKKQDQIQINRIMRIKRNLFPNNNLQEREIAFVYFMNKYGMQFWDKILDLLKDEEPFTHKKIYL